MKLLALVLSLGIYAQAQTAQQLMGGSPNVTPGCVVSVPGEWSDVELWAANIFLPGNELGGFTVSVDGVACAIHHVGPERLVFWMPLEAPLGNYAAIVNTPTGMISVAMHVVQSAPTLDAGPNGISGLYSPIAHQSIRSIGPDSVINVPQDGSSVIVTLFASGLNPGANLEREVILIRTSDHLETRFPALGSSAPGGAYPYEALYFILGSIPAGDYQILSRVGTEFSEPERLTIQWDGPAPLPRSTVRINNATIQRGQNGAVTVDLIALGGENKVGFSVTFDPAQLSFVQATAGSGAPGANVSVNISSVASGKLGIIVAKSAGSSFTPGTNQIAVLNFISNANGTAGSTPIDFADVPFPREVVVSDLTPRAANWIDGTVTITDACVYLVSPAVINFSAKGGTGIVSVTAGANCGWSVVNSIPWVSVTGVSGGTGNGAIIFQVDLNNGTNRAGSMDIAGHTFRVRQGAKFLDVPEDSVFYHFIGKVSAAGVTIGCNPNGTLFCPDQTVTREQMAAFIIRALGEFNPPPPVQQRFADVAPTSVFYPFINQMAERRITVGCDSQGTNYCPGQAVTREQMSAFMIRALGEFNPPVPAQQRFFDVTPANPFFAFIDQMAFRTITLGCNPAGTAYCPTSAVTRGQMAAFLVRAFGL